MNFPHTMAGEDCSAGPRLDAHCLLIGISSYQRIPALPVTRDAEDLAHVLGTPSLCAFPPDRVELLCEANATKPAIMDALDRLRSRARDGSSVLVYFSGHGGRSQLGMDVDCYLMPVDASWRNAESLSASAISGRELSAQLEKLRGARITTVLDCCRAAGLTEPKGDPESMLEPALSAQSVALLGRGRGRAVMAASRDDGLAYVNAAQRNSVFTHHLLDGLRGAANGAGGVIRICDLFHYVQQRVVAEQPLQQPVFKAELEENYPVALYRGGARPSLDLSERDTFRYDAFVSFCRVADRAWVEGCLAPKLEALGLRLCLAHRDFRLGMPRIREMERAVKLSRYTLGVFTPAYLEGCFEEFQALMAQYQALEQKAPRFVPILRANCALPLGVRMTELLDASEAQLETSTLERLAQRLRQPPIDADAPPSQEVSDGAAQSR